MFFVFLPDPPDPRAPRDLSGREILSRAADDVHGDATLETELACGAGPVRRDLQMVRTAEQREDFAGPRVAVRRHDARHDVPAHVDLERSLGQLVESLPV